MVIMHGPLDINAQEKENKENIILKISLYNICKDLYMLHCTCNVNLHGKRTKSGK